MLCKIKKQKRIKQNFFEKKNLLSFLFACAANVFLVNKFVKKKRFYQQFFIYLGLNKKKNRFIVSAVSFNLILSFYRLVLLYGNRYSLFGLDSVEYQFQLEQMQLDLDQTDTEQDKNIDEQNDSSIVSVFDLPPGTNQHHGSIPTIEDSKDSEHPPLRRTDSLSDLDAINEAQEKKDLMLENEDLQQALLLSRHEEQVARAQMQKERLLRENAKREAEERNRKDQKIKASFFNSKKEDKDEQDHEKEK